MIVEIKSTLADVTMFVVTTAEEGKALLDEGVGRGRVWSPKELEMLRVVGSTPEGRRAAVEMKLKFDARLQDVHLEQP